MKVTADGSFTYKVEDYYGDVVKKGKINSDGKSDKKINLTGDLGIGYYEIVVCSPKSGEPLDRTSISIVDDYNFETTRDTSLFGVNSHIGKNAHRHISDLVGEEAKKLGVGNLREGYYWHLMETVKGQCALNDNSLWYTAYKNGIGLYLTGGFRNYIYMPDEDIKYPTTAEAMEAFANYGQVLCDAFPSKYPLKEYEVWNEWWAWDYTEDAIERYAEIFDYTYDKLSVTEPDTKLITCFVNRDTPVDFDYNEELLKTNVAKQMDIATIHCYGGTQNSDTEKRPEIVSPVIESVASLRDLMTKYGVGDKEIWLTETGYSTFPIDVYGNSIRPENPNLLSSKFCISEKEAAMYYPRLILLGLSEGCGRVYTYQMCDGYYDITTQESFFGLLRGDETICGVYSPKPMYSTYAALIRALDNTEFKNLDVYGSCYEYTFANDTKTVTAVYSIDSKQNYEYSTDEPVKVVNVVGESKIVTPVNGKVILEIDGNVQYIID